MPGYGAYTATLEFEEWYAKVSTGWRMTDYQYELRFEPVGSARWAEHWHDDTYHRHCETPKERYRDHYPSRPIQLFDVRAELVRRFALGPPALNCSGSDY